MWLIQNVVEARAVIKRSLETALPPYLRHGTYSVHGEGDVATVPVQWPCTVSCIGRGFAVPH